jgi:predicted RNase H-like HicB family nuclease
MKDIKIIILKEEDGYVAFPIGLKGVVVSDGDTYEEAYQNIKEAIKFHIESFGEAILDEIEAPLEAYIADLKVSSIK